MFHRTRFEIEIGRHSSAFTSSERSRVRLTQSEGIGGSRTFRLFPNLLSGICPMQFPDIRTRDCGYVLGLCLIFACFLATQAFALDPSKNLGKYVVRTWTSQEGLPQNSITCLLQTHDGFLWIGTRNGLARFDGAGFTEYQAGVPNSIAGESITGLVEDRDGSLWISSNGGLSRYRRGHFRSYDTRDGLPEDSIWRIAADPAGGIWAATWHSQLFHFDGNTVQRFHSPVPPRPQEVNAVLEDSHGIVWIATFAGLFRLDPQTGFERISHSGLSGDRVYALALDSHHQLWLAGDGGLSHLVSDHFISISIPGLATATLLAFDPNSQDDAVWTGATGGGLIRFTRAASQRLGARKGLVSNEVYLLYFSKDGSLWAGAVDGLSELSDGAISSFAMRDSYPKAVTDWRKNEIPVRELLVGYGKRVIGVHGNSLVSFAFSASTASRSPDSGPLRLMSLGSRWIRTANNGVQGLVLSDGVKRGLRDQRALDRISRHIHWGLVDTLVVDRRGTVWTGGSDIGVIAYNADARPHVFNMRNGLDDDGVGVLVEDIGGDIWVGTLAGLNRIQNGVVKQVVPCARVTSIYPSPDGSIWAGCESGLLYVPPGSGPVRLFTRRNGLPTTLIQGVTEDALGFVWLGTNQGVVRIRAADLLTYGQDPRHGQNLFGLGDGLRNAQVVTNSLFRSASGSIWFMTLGELATIDPRAIQPRHVGPVLLDHGSIDEHETVFSEDSFEVPPGHHRLSIYYTLPEFQNASRLQFRYKLEGWDGSWIEAGSSRVATYTGIPPGHYTFRVANSDGYGNWNAGVAIPLAIEPFFYQTRWFYSSVALFIIALVWYLHRLRASQLTSSIDQRLQERLKERTRIARELHDTLLQGVLGVSMQMYVASHERNDSSAAVSLEEASHRLRDIAEQSRKAVEGLRAPSLSPASLEGVLCRAVQDIALPTGAQFTVSTSRSPLRVRPLVQAEIQHIVREAFANAARHSGASSISLDVVYHPANLLVSVRDDGTGIDVEWGKSGRKGHWGLRGMRERAEAIGGRVLILPHSPSGTIVEISVPGAVAYSTADTGRASTLRRLVRGLDLRILRELR